MTLEEAARRLSSVSIDGHKIKTKVKFKTHSQILLNFIVQFKFRKKIIKISTITAIEVLFLLYLFRFERENLV